MSQWVRMVPQPAVLNATEAIISMLSNLLGDRRFISVDGL